MDITYVQHSPTAVDLFYTYTEELSTSCLKIWEDSHSWARIVIVVIVIVIVVVIVIVIWGHVKYWKLGCKCRSVSGVGVLQKKTEPGR